MRIPPVIVLLALVATFGGETPAFAQFTDDPLSAGTPVKADHFIELRSVIANLRSSFGLPVFLFTDPTLTPNTTIILTVHLTELRAALNEVYAAAGKTPPAYTDPSPAGLAILAAHIQELRTGTANAAPNAAPSFTKGANQTVSEDAGAQSVVGWATSISAGAANESGQTVNFVIDTNDNPGLFSAGPAVAANGTLTYTPAANRHGVATITLHIHDNGGTVNGGIDNSATQAFTITVNAVNDPPVVPNRTADAQANIRVSIGGLLSGVTDAADGDNGCSPTFSLAGVSGTTSPAGGLVAITNAATGVVDFDPPPGVTGAVTFTYTVSDTGCPGTATSAAATVTVTVGGPVVWFVDSTGPIGGNGIWTGSNSRAFQTLAQADAVNLANDRVFVLNNNAVPLNYAGNFTMLSGERLIGQGVTGASFDAVVLGLTPPAGTVARPGINGVRPTLQGTTTLANGVTVTGVNFTPNSAVAAMTASGLATTAAITIDQTIVSGTGGATSALSLTNVTATGAGALNVSNASFTNTSGAELLVSGGNIPISLSATISSNAGRSIDIQNRTGGTVSLSGAITDTATGIFLNANTGSTINFTGGLSLTTGANPAFTATGGGTVTVTDPTGSANNLITTTTGTALNVANATIGASGLTFESINVDGNDVLPANGIVLNNTGTSAGLTVTGTGAAGSGGTVRDTSGDGVSLTSTAKTSLTSMTITSNLGSGIRGATLNGLVVNNSSITSNGDTAASDESGLLLTQLTGTSSGGTNPTSITNTTISNNHEFQIQITNTSGTLTNLTMSGNTISSTGASGAAGNLFNFLGQSTAVMTLTVTSGSFTGNAPSTATAISAVNQGTSHTVNVSGATFTNNNAGVDCSTDPIATTFTCTVSNNNFQGSRAMAINSFHNANSPYTRTFNGTFTNNTIGTAGVAGSGSALGNGISISNEGAISSANYLISGNQIRQVQSFPAISVNVGLGGLATGGGTTNLTITNNTISDIGSRGITVQDNQDATLGPFPTVCANVSGNSFSNIAGQAGNGEYMRLRRLNGTFRVTQATPTAAANGTELDDANGFNNPALINVSGTVLFSQAACTTPP